MGLVLSPADVVLFRETTPSRSWLVSELYARVERSRKGTKPPGQSASRNELLVHHFPAEVNARIDGIDLHVDALRLQHLEHDGRAPGPQRKMRAALSRYREFPRAERRHLHREGRSANRRQFPAPPAVRYRVESRGRVTQRRRGWLRGSVHHRQQIAGQFGYISLEPRVAHRKSRLTRNRAQFVARHTLGRAAHRHYRREWLGRPRLPHPYPCFGCF